jgi:hypothetical protein
MDPWEQLDALVTELQAANEEWSRSAEQLSGQLAAFKTITEQLDAALDALAVMDAIGALNERLFSGAARVHQARTYYGLSRVAALVWHAIEDPRPAMAAAAPGGMYSIEVRLGPRYLLGVQKDGGGAGDERLSILIEGEKQLVATLPTTAEKFRSALLRAFAAPGYSGPPRETGSEEQGAVDAGTGAGVSRNAEGNESVEEQLDSPLPPAAASDSAPQPRQRKPRARRTGSPAGPKADAAPAAAGQEPASGRKD